MAILMGIYTGFVCSNEPRTRFRFRGGRLCTQMSAAKIVVLEHRKIDPNDPRSRILGEE